MSRLFVLFGTGDWAPWCDRLFEELAVPGRHAAVVAAGQAENGPTVVDEYRRGAARYEGKPRSNTGRLVTAALLLFAAACVARWGIDPAQSITEPPRSGLTGL